MSLKSKSFKFILIAGICMSLAFPARSAYVVNGSAVPTGNDCFRLTDDIGSQGGMVWYSNFISLSYDFDMTFQVFLGYYDWGADGIAFVLQPNSTAAGEIGGGLGYMNITPSLAVEYDTWQNDDPWYDHIAVHKNGDVNSTTGAVAGPVAAVAGELNIEDGQWHSTRILWDATSQTLQVYFDGNLKITYSADIVNEFFGGDPAVYWGLTGATGGASNLQQFCVTSLYFQEANPVPLSPWVLGLAISLIVAVTVIRYRKSL